MEYLEFELSRNLPILPHRRGNKVVGLCGLPFAPLQNFPALCSPNSWQAGTLLTIEAIKNKGKVTAYSNPELVNGMDSVSAEIEVRQYV